MAIVAFALLSGCASAPALSLSGPWAAEFEKAYSESSDEFVREAVKDGRISDAEFAEMLARYTDCMADAGLTLKRLPEPEGGYSFSFPDTMTAEAANETDVRCSLASGEYPIGALYNWVKRNPDRLDEKQIIHDCLLREGVIGQQYTLEEFTRDYENFEYPFASDQDSMTTFEVCQADPLGLLR